MRVTRAALRPLLALAASTVFDNDRAALAATSAPAAAAPSTKDAVVTSKVFLDLRIIKRFDVEVLEDAAIRGRLVIGLYGNDAPKATQRFIEYCTGNEREYAKTPNGGPSYASATFDKVRPDELLEGGKIAGLKQSDFAGTQTWEYFSRLLPSLEPVIEANDLKHDRRGLLTIDRFGAGGGPEFGITFAPSPRLDDSREVIGGVESGFEMLAEIEALPYITGKSLEGEGTVANEVFQAQKALFGGLSKVVGDTRAEDRTGKLLRRVEIVQCGVL